MNGKKMNMFNLFSIILGGLLSACALAAAPIPPPLVARPSAPIINVRLPANPSTGYAWVLLKYDHNLMEKPNSRYLPPQNHLIGAPGYCVWQFKFKKSAFTIPQKTAVTLAYKRPWENLPGEKKVIRIEVHTQ